MKDNNIRQMYEIFIGNVPAGETTKVEIKIIKVLKMEAGYYHFALPIAMSPWSKMANHTEIDKLENFGININLKS